MESGAGQQDMNDFGKIIIMMVENSIGNIKPTIRLKEAFKFNLTGKTE